MNIPFVGKVGLPLWELQVYQLEFREFLFYCGEVNT